MYRKVETGDEAGGGALSEKLQEARTMTKEYASAAVLKKLAEARHGTPMGTVRPPFVPAPRTAIRSRSWQPPPRRSAPSRSFQVLCSLASQALVSAGARHHLRPQDGRNIA